MACCGGGRRAAQPAPDSTGEAGSTTATPHNAAVKYRLIPQNGEVRDFRSRAEAEAEQERSGGEIKRVVVA